MVLRTSINISATAPDVDFSGALLCNKTALAGS